MNRNVCLQRPWHFDRFLPLPSRIHKFHRRYTRAVTDWPNPGRSPEVRKPQGSNSPDSTNKTLDTRSDACHKRSARLHVCNTCAVASEIWKVPGTVESAGQLPDIQKARPLKICPPQDLPSWKGGPLSIFTSSLRMVHKEETDEAAAGPPPPPRLLWSWPAKVGPISYTGDPLEQRSACRGISWLLLGNIFYIFAYCGLVVEIQPLNCQNSIFFCSPSNVNQDIDPRISGGFDLFLRWTLGISTRQDVPKVQRTGFLVALRPRPGF